MDYDPYLSKKEEKPKKIRLLFHGVEVVPQTRVQRLMADLTYARRTGEPFVFTVENHVATYTVIQPETLDFQQLGKSSKLAQRIEEIKALKFTDLLEYYRQVFDLWSS